MTINFRNMRLFGESPNHAFEELVCQLARRNPPSDAVEFRRVEGAGGDGGVEAYWILRDRSKVGYQAKYFLQSGKINWSQVDKSVKTALSIHPELRQEALSANLHMRRITEC